MAESPEGRLPEATLDPDLVEYLMVVVPELGSLSTLANAVQELVGSELIRVLDLVCVTREAEDGRLTVLELEEVASMSGLADVEGEVGGLLSSSDIEVVAAELHAGATGLILVVEDRWAESLSAAARRAGGRVLGGARVPQRRLDESRAAHGAWEGAGDAQSG